MGKFNFKQLDNKSAFKTLSILLMVLIALWIILYAVPGLLASLFNTILGNIILLVVIILVGIKDIKFAIGLIILFIVIFKFSYYVVKKREGFDNSLLLELKHELDELNLPANKYSNKHAPAHSKRHVN